MRYAVNLISSHGLSVVTGIVVGWIVTLWFIDSTSNSWSSVDLLSATGSILAGTGTVGLLFIAIVKGDSWFKQNLHNKAIELIFSHTENINLIANDTKRNLTFFFEDIRSARYETLEYLNKDLQDQIRKEHLEKTGGSEGLAINLSKIGLYRPNYHKRKYQRYVGKKLFEVSKQLSEITASIETIKFTNHMSFKTFLPLEEQIESFQKFCVELLKEDVPRIDEEKVTAIFKAIEFESNQLSMTITQNIFSSK